MWNPPLIDEAPGTRRSPLSEAADLLAELVAAGTRTICFLRSRRGIELIQRFAAEEARGGRAAASWRRGSRPTAPATRRSSGARSRPRWRAASCSAVVATDALELGIDIGELDAAICVTFPGTVASLRQMWGRAGRRRSGLAVYVAGQDALDQFFCRHPDEFLERPVEAAILDHRNRADRLPHLLAAAYEAPLGGTDARSTTTTRCWGRAGASAPSASSAGRAAPGPRRALFARGPGFPAGGISLRSASADSVAVVERSSGELLGSVEAERAFTTVHPGAVYLHLGRSYEVRELDVDGRRAIV